MIHTNPVLFYVILAGTVLFIIALNISLFSMVKDKSLQNQINMTKSISHKLQSPWKDEEDDLAELSRIVKNISTEKPDNYPE